MTAEENRVKEGWESVIDRRALEANSRGDKGKNWLATLVRKGTGGLAEGKSKKKSFMPEGGFERKERNCLRGRGGVYKANLVQRSRGRWEKLAS